MKQLPVNRRQQFGKLGEQLAASYLIHHGYHILSRNVRTSFGEIDIVATLDNALVFIEVKTRTSREYGMPQEAVTGRKLNRIIHAAAVYCSNHSLEHMNQRVDVIAVDIDTFGHCKNLRHLMNVTA